MGRCKNKFNVHAQKRIIQKNKKKNVAQSRCLESLATPDVAFPKILWIYLARPSAKEPGGSVWCLERGRVRERTVNLGEKGETIMDLLSRRSPSGFVSLRDVSLAAVWRAAVHRRCLEWVVPAVNDVCYLLKAKLPFWCLSFF